MAKIDKIAPATEAIDAETGEVTQTAAADETVDDMPDFDPALETLLGDTRDAMLMRIRTLQKPWSQMAEYEQTMCANAIEQAAKDIIRRIVRLINQHEWDHAVVDLGEVKIGGTKGIEAKITCANIAHNRNVLGEHVGSQVMILMVDSETFMAERAPAAIDKDQPDLDLPAGDDPGIWAAGEDGGDAGDADDAGGADDAGTEG